MQRQKINQVCVPESQELDPPRSRRVTPRCMLLSYAHCHFSKIHIEIIREHISWIFYTAKYSNLLPGKSTVIPRFVALNVKNRLSKKWTTPWH